MAGCFVRQNSHIRLLGRTCGGGGKERLRSLGIKHGSVVGLIGK